MKNKKVDIFLSSIVVLIGGIFSVNQIYNKSKNKQIPKKNNLAIMIKGESGEYISSDAIPKGNYILNEEKTVCENGGKVVSYNNSTGQIGFSFLGSDRCSLYFDKIIDTEPPTISNLTVSGNLVTATLSDNENLSGYGLSTSSTVEPSSYTQISGKSYNLSINITTEGTCYLWVKDSAGNIAKKDFTISLGTSFETLMVANNSDIFDENGLRYEGTDPNNYICLDNQKEGTCSDTSLLFRIIGLFEEDTSSDGTNSSGTKKLLKVIDTNAFGGTSGKYWNSSLSNDWSNASLKLELNETYLNSIVSTSNINSKLSSSIVNAKWHLGGVNATSSSIYYNQKITLNNFYKAERAPYATSGSLQNKNSSNPDYIYAKIGLMYPSDYGFATIGGSTSNKNTCATVPLFSWSSFTYSTQYKDCGSNDWIFVSLNKLIGTSGGEWMISPDSVTSYGAAIISWTGSVSAMNGTAGSVVSGNIVRPTFYLDSSILKIVGGTGTSTDPYHIG